MRKTNASDHGGHSTTSHELAADPFEKIFAQTWWGEIELTDAIRPQSENTVLHRGFEAFCFHQPVKVPNGIMVSETKSKLYGLFMDALALFGDPVNTLVDVWLDYHGNDKPVKKVVWECELVVLLSQLWGAEDLFMNNGEVGIAVTGHESLPEIQFDAHKMIFMYSASPAGFKQAIQFLIPRQLNLRTPMNSILCENHIHSTNDRLTEEFHTFCLTLGADIY